VWTLIVFVILLAVLWKFAWGPIAAGLDKREHGIADNIASAARLQEEAKSLLAQYEAKLDSAADEVRKVLDEGRRDAEHVKQSILAEAKAAADAERTRSLREIETATDAALQSLAERSAKLAVNLAGKIVRTNLSPGDHERLIQEAVEKFPSSSPSNN
jgi:F-type H+-transporting ATPase subunit b